MISDNFKSVQSRYGDHNPTLVAVSKQQPDSRIDDALNFGLRIFGENRVQEAQQRWLARKVIYPNLELHLIGPLQSNKVKDACDLFDVIHTLDREKLARKIAQYCPDIPCFIQVNTGSEPQKTGISFEKLDNFYQFCIDLGMNIIGLMCIPPVGQPPEIHFKLLQDKAKDLNLPNLSMGMSGDFDIALQYGATHIRVGSKLFGER